MQAPGESLPDPAPVPFTALVLAGTRPGGDPMATAAGVSHKALVPVCGVPMLARVLRALKEAQWVDRLFLCGVDAALVESIPELRASLRESRLRLLESRPTPSASVVHATEVVPDFAPMLVTTGDHPVLTGAIVDDFCLRAAATGADVVVGLVDADRVRSAFPDTKRTYLRFRDGEYCGSNLFALLTTASRRAPVAWMEVESHRKRPWRIVRALGPLVLLRFLLGRLGLDDVIGFAADKMQLRVRAIILPQPEAAVDVDKPEDLALVEHILSSRTPSPPQA